MPQGLLHYRVSTHGMVKEVRQGGGPSGDQLGDGDRLAAEGKGASFGGLANDGGWDAQLADAGKHLIGAVGGGGHEHAGGGLGEGCDELVLVDRGEVQIEAEAGAVGSHTGALSHLKGGDGKATLGDIVCRGKQLIAVEELGVRMLEEGGECKEVVTQLSAATKALDRAGFAIIATGLEQCLTNPEESMDKKEMEKLFLSLA